jgi:hypothetical protein
VSVGQLSASSSTTGVAVSAAHGDGPERDRHEDHDGTTSSGMTQVVALLDESC